MQFLKMRNEQGQYLKKGKQKELICYDKFGGKGDKLMIRKRERE